MYIVYSGVYMYSYMYIIKKKKKKKKKKKNVPAVCLALQEDGGPS